jgi:hypothetical protein
MYYTDVIEHAPVTAGNFEETIGTYTEYNVRVEDNNRIIRTGDGSEVKPKYLIMAPKNFPGLRGDKIRVKATRGETLATIEEYTIAEVYNGGGFVTSHKEIFV